jgi:DNA-binding transcriptional ArsR family regulator
MAHPVRVKILELLNEESLAPVDVARKLAMPLSNVSYHFRVLLELDSIEPVKTEQRRGSIKTTYQSRINLMFRELCWNGVGGKAMSELLRATLKATAQRVADALTAKTFERRDDLHISLSTVSINEDSWIEIVGLCGMVMDRVAEIAREEADTEPQAGEQRLPVTVSLMAYESPKLYE